MNGLELFKAELMDKLNEKLSIEAVETVMNTIDVISDHFSVTGECRELSTASGRTAKMINYYINARKLEGLAESTLKSYQDSLNYFFGVVKKPVEEITVHDVRGYLYSYNESHEIKKSSLERYRIILSAFF